MHVQRISRKSITRLNITHVKGKHFTSVSTSTNAANSTVFHDTTGTRANEDLDSSLTALDRRVLHLLQRTAGTKRYDIWSDVMRRIGNDKARKRRIGVLNVSGLHGSSFIKALVGVAREDEAVREAIDTRWESVPSPTSRVVIKNGERVARFGPVLEVPSPLLGELDAEVLEIRDPEHASTLVRTDVPIVLAPPDIQAVPSIIHRIPGSVTLLEPSSSHTNLCEWKSSLQSFNDDPDALVRQIKVKLSKVNVSGNDNAMRRTAVLAMLDECAGILDASKRDLSFVKEEKELFMRRIEAILGQLRAQLDSIDLTTQLEGDKKRLQQYVDSFKWYKVWEIDEVEERLEAGIEGNYGTELERKLEWHAGTMSAAQERIKQITGEYIARVAPSLQSSQLVNTIDQLETNSLPVPPSSFTAAVSHRRQQLSRIATPFLQRRFVQRSQAALVAMPIISGVPTICWANGLLDASSALPGAAFGILICVRQIARGWEKGYRKWWKDYDRIQSGLEYDITRVVNETLETKLRALPLAAVQRSSELLAEREVAIEALSRETQETMKEIEGPR